MKDSIKGLVTALLFFSIMTLVALAVNAQITYHQPIIQKTDMYINPFYEEINTLEDCIEWLDEDMHNETISLEIGALYIENIQKVIVSLEKTPSVSYKQHKYIKEREILETKR